MVRDDDDEDEDEEPEPEPARRSAPKAPVEPRSSCRRRS